MRNITTESVNAFLNDKSYKKANTEVKAPTYQDSSTKLYLHGHLIAIKKDNELQISNCGYFTNVTKERLNGLPNVSIQQKKGKWYLNGKEWDGKMIAV